MQEQLSLAKVTGRQRVANPLRAGGVGALVRREVVITGIGLVLPNCDDRGEFWRYLMHATSQLSLVPDPSDASLTVLVGRIAPSVTNRHLSEVPAHHVNSYSREVRVYLASLLLARADADLSLDGVPTDRIGLYDGSSRGAVEFWTNGVRAESTCAATDVYSKKDILSASNGQTVGVAAALLGATGRALAVGGSCAAGLIAVSEACRDIETDLTDVAFATGHDVALTPGLFAMYGDAGLLRRKAASPDSADRPGRLAFAEGAATVVLEDRRTAVARGARILGRVTAHGHRNEGRNPFAVDATGQSQARLIRSVLRLAGRGPDDVGFVVGHGNGLTNSDAAERRYMRLVFAERADSVPFISTKPVFGHTLGASGTVNVAAAALILHSGEMLPPYMPVSRSSSQPLERAQTAGTRAARRSVDCGLVFACGMGGFMSACLLEREELGTS